MQLVLPLDGFCLGPLFAPPRKRRHPKRRPDVIHDHGRMRRAAEARATPAWSSRAAVRSMYRAADERTRETGWTWSVGHLVPLLSPYVCGLHCEANLVLEPLDYNMRKGNREWPDMWETQMEMWA